MTDGTQPTAPAGTPAGINQTQTAQTREASPSPGARTSARAAASTGGDTGYVVGTWNGHDNYRCPMCQFAVLDSPDLVIGRGENCQREDCPVRAAIERGQG
jgi:hypothetical protein